MDDPIHVETDSDVIYIRNDMRDAARRPHVRRLITFALNALTRWRPPEKLMSNIAAAGRLLRARARVPRNYGKIHQGEATWQKTNPSTH